MVLNVGDSAPDFELADTDLKMRKLNEFLDKKVVLSFIVAASSPVCETELCTFRDSWNDISNLGAHVVAISNDGPFANKAFAEKNNFDFPILGDYNSKTIKDYDILVPDLLHLKDYNFAKRSVFIIETACCSVEFGAASGPRYDVERFGIIEAFGSLRQCDLVVVQGTITRKMAPRLRLVYDQMPEPKYVIAMGACAITGGLYFDSYNVLPGIDGILPVDVYVPGCPPRPETLIQGCMLLQEKIKRMKPR